jgi:hypothetical protein
MPEEEEYVRSQHPLPARNEAAEAHRLIGLTTQAVGGDQRIRTTDGGSAPSLMFYPSPFQTSAVSSRLH